MAAAIERGRREQGDRQRHSPPSRIGAAGRCGRTRREGGAGQHGVRGLARKPGAPQTPRRSARGERVWSTRDQLREALLAQSVHGQRLGATLVGLGLLTERELAEALAEQSGLDARRPRPRGRRPRSRADCCPRATPSVWSRSRSAATASASIVAVADPYADRAAGGADRAAAGARAPASWPRLPTSCRPSRRCTCATTRWTRRCASFEERAEQRKRAVAGDQATGIDDGRRERAGGARHQPHPRARRPRAGQRRAHRAGRRERAVRLRTDGALHQVMSLPVEMGPPLLSRIKVMANLNIVERRRPQDGTSRPRCWAATSTCVSPRRRRCSARWPCSACSTSARACTSCPRLGMPEDTEARYRELIRTPFGLVVCAGPTGAGKTTTLYATLAAVNNDAIKVATIEDPVEYVIPQHQPDPDPRGRRAHVRQRAAVASCARTPTRSWSGEIRDVETARIAVQAALTGHFVMSSLHATDASAALHRFLDMGIEPFLLASSLTGVVGQRLVRRNCPRCSEPYAAVGRGDGVARAGRRRRCRRPSSCGAGAATSAATPGTSSGWACTRCSAVTDDDPSADGRATPARPTCARWRSSRACGTLARGRPSTSPSHGVDHAARGHPHRGGDVMPRFDFAAHRRRTATTVNDRIEADRRDRGPAGSCCSPTSTCGRSQPHKSLLHREFGKRQEGQARRDPALQPADGGVPAGRAHAWSTAST